MKKIAVLLMAAALALFSAGTLSNAQTDLTTMDKFVALQQDRILEGRSNGDPALDASLTRAELATILFRIYKLSPVTSPISFSDTAGHWAQTSGYIEAIVQAHLMEGEGGGIFDPDRPVTIEQLATVLLRMTKSAAAPATTPPQGVTSAWAQDIVATALDKKLIKTAADYTQPISRGDVIDDLYPVYEQIKSDATATAAVPYNLELSRWSIYNDGTHPTETTNGFNQALQWAHEQGYNVFKVPAGTYMISKGTGPYDPNSRINMVSSMTFLLDDNAVMRKETNGYAGYSLLYVGPPQHDVVIRGGTYKGDKDTHDYSSGGTHEGGYGILAVGVNRITIDGVKTFNFTGDGICIGGYYDWVGSLYGSDFESGAIDDKGNLIADSQHLRIKKTSLAKTQLNLDKHPERITLELERPAGITNSDVFDVYFYRADGTFISSAKDQQFYWSYIPIPRGAATFNAVFHGSAVLSNNESVKGTDGRNGMGIYAKSKTDNAVIQNSESAFNRRQGITIGGGDNITVVDNVLHDMAGTAPQSGIDVEGGGSYPTTHFTIARNRFYNNKSYDLILYDGKDAVVSGNEFGASKIGVAISDPFTGVVIRDNKFEGASIYATHDATILNNTVRGSSVGLYGRNLKVDGLELIDSSLTVNSPSAGSIDVANVTMTNSGAAKGATLSVLGQPSHLANVTIQGPVTRPFGGTVAGGSIFDNVKIIGYDASLALDLPPGTYNGCLLEPKAGGVQPAELNDAATYAFNNCTFRENRAALVVNNKDAAVTVTDSSFTVQAADGYGIAVIDALSAKEVVLKNNTIDAKTNTVPSLAAIKIGKPGGATSAAQVLKATVDGNTIYSKLPVAGISTVDAGIGAPAYLITNNTLYNAKLQLKAGDISSNNKELSQ